MELLAKILMTILFTSEYDRYKLMEFCDVHDLHYLTGSYENVSWVVLMQDGKYYMFSFIDRKFTGVEEITEKLYEHAKNVKPLDPEKTHAE